MKSYEKNFEEIPGVRQKRQCVICGQDAWFVPSPTCRSTKEIYIFLCPRCGGYYVDESPNLVNMVKDEDKMLLSTYLRQHYEFSYPKKIPIMEFNEWLEAVRREYIQPSVLEKISMLLEFLAKKSDYIGAQVEYDYQNDFTVFGGKRKEEFQALYNYLLELGLVNGRISYNADKVKISLTVKGWEKIEESLNRINSRQVFVAMSYDENNKELGEYLGSVKEVCSRYKFEAFVISEKHHNNNIINEMIKEIKRSKFVVADLTQQRPNVYFEAGFGMGLRREVILTCKKVEEKRVHFDLAQYNIIFWNPNNWEEFKKYLDDRIGAMLD